MARAVGGTTAVVGAGPVGLVCARALADRGEQVLLFDRDPGPPRTGPWRRTGVMQFAHPHFFRHQVREVLQEHAPAMWEAVVASGCVVNPPPEGVPPEVTTLSARRSTFEGALRAAVRSDRVRHVRAHVDRVVVEGDRVTGVVAEGAAYDVDRVVVATGRAAQLADDLRPAGERSACGQSYVSRTYRARPGVAPLVSWTPLGAAYDGYLAMAFPQDAGTLSALVVRPSDDAAWAPLSRNECFEAVVAQIPNLAPWTDPDRFEPVTDVMRGGTLVNSYRGQGHPPAGLFWVGDTVCTTNPSAGRGVSTGLLQVAALLRAWCQHDDDRDASAAFDLWCLQHVKPWYDDHVAVDASTARAYAHRPVDPEGPLTSDVVVAAAEVDPVVEQVVFLHLGMVALPSVLEPAHDRVRALLRSGWQPRPSAGPTRDELVDRMAGIPVQRRGQDAGAVPAAGRTAAVSRAHDGAGPVPSR